MGSAETNFYNDAIRRAGYEDDARAVQALWVDGKRDQAVARVPDELVLRFGLVGNRTMVQKRLNVYREAGINCINLRVQADDTESRIESLERALDALRD